MKQAKQIALVGIFTLAIGMFIVSAAIDVEIRSQSAFVYPRIECVVDYLGLAWYGDISPSNMVQSIFIAFIGIAPVAAMLTVLIYQSMASLHSPIAKRVQHV